MNTDNDCAAYTQGTTPYVACLMEAKVPKDSTVPNPVGQADRLDADAARNYVHNEGFGQKHHHHTK